MGQLSYLNWLKSDWFAYWLNYWSFKPLSLQQPQKSESWKNHQYIYKFTWVQYKPINTFLLFVSILIILLIILSNSLIALLVFFTSCSSTDVCYFGFHFKTHMRNCCLETITKVTKLTPFSEFWCSVWLSMCGVDQYATQWQEVLESDLVLYKCAPSPWLKHDLVLHKFHKHSFSKSPHLTHTMKQKFLR